MSSIFLRVFRFSHLGNREFWLRRFSRSVKVLLHYATARQVVPNIASCVTYFATGKIVARQVGETAAESRIEFSERFRPLQTGMLNRAQCFVQFISLISRDKLHETLHIVINGASNPNVSAAWTFSYEKIMFCSLVEWSDHKN